MIGEFGSTAREADTWPGLARRLAAFAFLAAFLALAIGIDLSQGALSAVSRSLSSLARERAAAGGLAPLVGAALASVLWLLWLIGRGLLLFGAFLIAEVVLVGPPRSWRMAGFALSVQ